LGIADVSRIGWDARSLAHANQHVTPTGDGVHRLWTKTKIAHGQTVISETVISETVISEVCRLPQIVDPPLDLDQGKLRPIVRGLRSTAGASARDGISA
jgi:hypothetical protein